MLAVFKDWPQKKVILSQNHFYSAYRLPDLDTYAAHKVTDVICTSHAIFDHARLRHPDVRAHIVPYSIDRTLFQPGEKEDIIAFLPRKRPIEAAYIRDLFRALHPKYRHWKWHEVSNVGEGDVAKAMSRAKVFLSLSRLEGFGLTPLEAMAADCIVAGFTGIGGKEYAKPENGFWADEDDFPPASISFWLLSSSQPWTDRNASLIARPVRERLLHIHQPLSKLRSRWLSQKS